MLDDQNELKEREIQFICDPSKKELFSDEDDEEDEMELVNTLLILAVVCILYRMYVYF